MGNGSVKSCRNQGQTKGLRNKRKAKLAKKRQMEEEKRQNKAERKRDRIRRSKPYSDRPERPKRDFKRRDEGFKMDWNLD